MAAKHTKHMTLSPLEAYDLSAEQKYCRAATHLKRLVTLYQKAAGRANSSPAVMAFVNAVEEWRKQRPDTSLADAVRSVYRDVALSFGLRRIDPESSNFDRDLSAFFVNYKSNFPLPTEQESKPGFRALLRAGPLEAGYEERAYSVVCPLTRRYLLGLNFTIQPLSDSVHFIYGFVMPCVRGGWGFGGSLIELMREIAAKLIDNYFQRYPEDRPPYYEPRGPLILFEKNLIEEMTLGEILMDSAGVDVSNPPAANTDLASSAIGQSLRDLIWDRLGGKVIRYHYIQSSLDGMVTVDTSMRDKVISFLNGQPLLGPDEAAARQALNMARGTKKEGCTTLELCAFPVAGGTSLPTAQVRRANEIFQTISVMKGGNISKDIYFQAQMASLEQSSHDERVALVPIRPAGPGAVNFHEAESKTRQLLGVVSWQDLQQAGDRTYREWMVEKADLLVETVAGLPSW
jgi:hypothetical protein